jgi:hypothetical protein
MQLPFAVGKDHQSGHMPNICQKVGKITKAEIEQSIMCRVKPKDGSITRIRAHEKHSTPHSGDAIV